MDVQMECTLIDKLSAPISFSTSRHILLTSIPWMAIIDTTATLEYVYDISYLPKT